MTTRSMILAAALAAGCGPKYAKIEGLEQKVDQAPQEDVKTLVLEAAQDARVREASPNENFGSQNGYVGSSADGFDRYLVQFDLSALQGKKVKSAKLQVDALSGTCLSSYNREICDLPIEVVASTVRDLWDERTVTWNTAPDTFNNKSYIVTDSGAASVDNGYKAMVHVPYQGTGTLEIDLTKYIEHFQAGVANGVVANGVNPGFMLKAANDTDETRAFERSVFELKDGEPLHIGREVQRDVVLGSKETDHASRLVIEYYQ